MGLTKITAKVVHQEPIATGVYSLTLDVGEMAATAKAGQFVNVYSKDGARMLPRPISICQCSKESGTIRLVYRVVGKGTEEFSNLKAEDTIDIMGPLGNGFTLSSKKAILMGGGIGIPPMLELAQELSTLGMPKEDIQVVLGYRDEIFLAEEFQACSTVYIASEDGLHGTKGNVLDAVREHKLESEAIYACGPTPMLKAIGAYGMEQGISCQISLEEKMACGIGACLACVCKSKDVDHHTHVKNKRICKDGPVFFAEEVEW